MPAELDLTAMLKMAKSKKMFFAFVPKGADGKLIVSKTKIPPKLIVEARQEIGSSIVWKGKCFGPINDMVFQVAKPAPATLAAALKKVAKRDAGLNLIADFQVAADAESEEEEAANGTAAGAPAAKPATLPNLAVWQAARQKAISELKALATKVAATKHASAVGVLKEIQSVIARLPAEPRPDEIDKLEAFIRTDDTISAVDEVPDHFHNQNLRDDLLKALAALKQ
jgi:hypothetical protein